MAEYISQSADLPNEDGEKRYEVVMLASGVDGIVVDDASPLPVTSVPTGSSTTAFGENYGLTITPVIQLEAVYGLNADRWNTYTAVSGSVTTPNSAFVLESGTSQNGYATIQTRRTLRYRSGQGALCRFTGAFENPAAGYTQRAGLGSLENALQVGYNGTSFGVLRATGGKAEIWHLTINNPATGSETVTINLNSVAYTVSVTAGTVAQNAAKIANATFTGWNASSHDSHVHFQRQSLGPAAGTYSISSTGTLTGTLTQLNAGVVQTENWTYQQNFNIDKLDGTGPSGMVIDPSKLNVYQINFRWLGAGEIRYGIEDEATGNMIFFHHDHYVNKNSTPHLINPSMKIQYVAASVGGTGTNVKTTGCSVMGAIEGDIIVTYLPNSVSNTYSTSILAATHQHMLSIRNDIVFNNKINQREIILKGISAAANSASSSPIVVTLYKNSTTAGLKIWSNIGNDSFTSYSTTDTTIIPASDLVVYQAVIIPGAANVLDVSNLRIALPPGDYMSVGVYGSNNIQNCAVSLIWVED